MAVWSRFASKNITKLELARKLIASLKNGAQGKGINYVPVRNAHDRTLVLKPSTYDGFKIKDLMYFYVAIAVIPLGAIILYCNIFIGPATLALIPEGYNPKPWEYHRHPITRFFAQYLTPSKQELYERSCHSLFEKRERYDIRQLELKIHELMKQRQDYQAWYFEKPPSKYIRHLNRDIKESQQESLQGPGWVK